MGALWRDPSLSSLGTLRQLVRGKAHTVPPSISVRETLLKLDADRIDAIVVVDEASRVALGIVTLRDVLRRIAIEAGELDADVLERAAVVVVVRAARIVLSDAGRAAFGENRGTGTVDRGVANDDDAALRPSNLLFHYQPLPTPRHPHQNPIDAKYF